MSFLSFACLVAKAEVSLYKQFSLIASRQMYVYSFGKKKDKYLTQNIIVLSFLPVMSYMNDQLLHNQIILVMIFTLIYLFSSINE